MIDKLTRVKGECLRVLSMMKGGCEECSCPKADPASIRTLQWVLDVIEHEEAKDDETDV